MKTEKHLGGDLGVLYMIQLGTNQHLYTHVYEDFNWCLCAYVYLVEKQLGHVNGTLCLCIFIIGIVQEDTYMKNLIRESCIRRVYNNLPPSENEH